VFEIVELDLDGGLSALGLQHVVVPTPRPDGQPTLPSS
jgi:hypothetical protein